MSNQPAEFNNKHGRTLRIEPDGVRVVTPEREMAFFFDTPEQAHRAALAILTGPGKVDVTDQSDPSTIHLRDSVRSLNQHFEYIAAWAAAEAEAAELETEARHLHRALAPHVLWGSLDCSARKNWIDVAREARRLHTNKETQHG